jgi:hypothetical protein
VLKGGVLLAAYGLRRPTADIDLAALRTSNDVDEIRRLVTQVAATALPADMHDGLSFDLDHVTAQTIRDADQDSGVRVRLLAGLASARESFHVDVNVGDPIWPGPTEVSLPRLLQSEPIKLRGYPMEMILAEKIVTALERGQANTRWRDFGDVYTITGRYAFRADEVQRTLRTVAQHRRIDLAGFDEAFHGYAELAQPEWTSWRQKLQLNGSLPANFRDALDALVAFADPILAGSFGDSAAWDPAKRIWTAN